MKESPFVSENERATRHRWALIALDQAASSVSSIVCTIAIARVLSDLDFGVYSTAYASFALFISLARAFFGIAIAAGAGDELILRKARFDAAFSAMVLVSLPVALLVGAATVLAIGFSYAGADYRWIVLLCAVATPLAMLQDVGRYHAVAVGKSGIALTSDLVWLLGGTVLLFVGPLLTVNVVIAVWLGIVMLSLIVVLVSLRPKFDVQMGIEILRPGKGTRESVAVTVLLSGGLGVIIAIMVGPTFGPAAVGYLRGAGTLFGPVNTAIAFLDFAILSALAKRDRAKDERTSLLLIAVMASIAVAWSLALLLLPDNVGREILGETWIGARALLPVTAVEYSLLSVTAAVATVLKIRSRAFDILAVRLLSFAVILAGAAVVVMTGGELVDISIALAIGALVGFVASLVALYSATRRRGVSPGRPDRLILASEVRLKASNGGLYSSHSALSMPTLSEFEGIAKELEVVCRVEVDPGARAAFEIDQDRVRVHRTRSFNGWIGLAVSIVPIVVMLARVGTRDSVFVGRMPEPMSILLYLRARSLNARFVTLLVSEPQQLGESLRPGRWSGRLIGRWLAAMTRSSVLYSTAVVYVTERVLQQKYPARDGATTLSRSNVIIPPDFIATTSRNHTSDRDASLLLVSVGALGGSTKGFDILCRAVAELRSRGIGVRLVVAGGGAQLTRAQKFAEELGIGSDVDFVGHLETREEMMRLLDSASLFVSASRAEGLSRAMLEAMSRALPVVATRVGGTEEVLDDRYLVPPGDFRELARRIESLSESPTAMDEASAQNLKQARRVAARSSTGSLRAFLTQALGGGGQ